MVRPERSLLVRSVSMAIRIASLVSLVFIEAGSSLLSKFVPEFDQANLNVLHPNHLKRYTRGIKFRCSFSHEELEPLSDPLVPLFVF